MLLSTPQLLFWVPQFSVPQFLVTQLPLTDSSLPQLLSLIGRSLFDHDPSSSSIALDLRLLLFTPVGFIIINPQSSDGHAVAKTLVPTD